MSWQLIVESVYYAREIGLVKSFNVSDTAPTVNAHTTAQGVAIPNGWRARPGWDYHIAGQAVDFGGYQQSSLSKFFMTYQWRLMELIHYVSPGEQYGIKHGANWGYAYASGHDNHVHVAIDYQNAMAIRNEMKSRYDAEMARREREAGMRKILVQGPDGRIWLSNGVKRIHVADHDKTDLIEDGTLVLKDTQWVNTQVIAGLVNNKVMPVNDLDAFGKELPPSFPENIAALESKVDAILEQLRRQ